MTQRFVRTLGALLAVLTSVAPAMAQGVGSIGGTVSDTSGAVLPGVTVTLTLDGGGVGSGQTSVTNEQGAYQFTRLVPGIYIVRAELQGFRSVEQRNISVNSDQVSRADFRRRNRHGGRGHHRQRAIAAARHLDWRQADRHLQRSARERCRTGPTSGPSPA